MQQILLFVWMLLSIVCVVLTVIGLRRKLRNKIETPKEKSDKYILYILDTRIRVWIKRLGESFLALVVGINGIFMYYDKSYPVMFGTLIVTICLFSILLWILVVSIIDLRSENILEDQNKNDTN